MTPEKITRRSKLFRYMKKSILSGGINRCQAHEAGVCLAGWPSLVARSKRAAAKWMIEVTSKGRYGIRCSMVLFGLHKQGFSLSEVVCFK